MSAAQTSLMALEQEAAQLGRRHGREQLCASVFQPMADGLGLRLPQFQSAAAGCLLTDLPLPCRLSDLT